MFLIISSYFLMVLILFWSYCGYLILLHLLSIFSDTEDKQENFQLPTEYPDVLIVVPCYNEELMIKQKIRNLEEAQYPKKHTKVYFIDGGSSDSTLEIIKAEIIKHKNWSVEISPEKGKINQLNYALSMNTDQKLIMCTDVDAHLEPDTLNNMVSVLKSQDNIGVVGANISPDDQALDIEKQFWEDQNSIRHMESSIHSSSIVVAPAYLYKREFIEQFPSDCVADDLYITLAANSHGYRVKYLLQHGGKEIRTPTNIKEYITHKFRKGNAYIMELLRFSYQFPRFEPLWKIIFFTKVLQTIVCPWLIPYWVLATISLLLGDAARQEIALMGIIFLGFSMVITGFIMSKKRLKEESLQNMKFSKHHMLYGFVLNNMIMLLIGITYPFYRQDSSYSKINSN